MSLYIVVIFIPDESYRCYFRHIYQSYRLYFYAPFERFILSLYEYSVIPLSRFNLYPIPIHNFIPDDAHSYITDSSFAMSHIDSVFFYVADFEFNQTRNNYALAVFGSKRLWL